MVDDPYAKLARIVSVGALVRAPLRCSESWR
jgi:hypothetical protein